MLQSASTSDSNGPSGDAVAAPVVAVPVLHYSRFTPTVPPAQNPPSSVGPILGALCCLGFILLAIASTIVLSLIPLYTERRDVTPNTRRQSINLLVPLPVSPFLPLGELNPTQLAILQNYLQQRLNSLPGGQNANITVTGARVISTPNGNVLVIDAVITGANPETVRRFLDLLNNQPLPPEVLQALVDAATTTTTPILTTTTNASNTTNVTRSLFRRSLDEGGAPAGIIYIDSHQIAAVKGIVKSVSFYVDRTCALANIEFAAFDLIDRNTAINHAQLRLSHRSGPIKLGPASDLKPYMALITIDLCDPDQTITSAETTCEGTKFAVEPHQYIGIRSDKCRLGFTPTPNNPVIATTWKPQDATFDPLAEPYQTISYVPSDYTVLHSVNIEPSETPTIKQNKLPSSSSTNSPRVLFVGSFPPRRCGLAKFLEDLTNSYPGPHSVVAVDESGADVATRQYSDKVVFRLNQTDREAYFTLANMINTGAYDIVNIQHEYALYDGMYGEYVVSLLSAIKKPVITTLHTIIPEPNLFTLSLTRALCSLSTRVMVMANLGRHILIDVYGIDESKIIVIPHGVPDVPFDHSLADNKQKLGLDPDAPTMSTFGLIHRNKNIQLALKAMQTIIKSEPKMTYLIIGQTHPIIQKMEGERYRRELESNVTALGLTNNVRFVDKFIDNDELLSYLGATDVYLTPYAREDQYVSGTLSWAVGLGKVVVSTPYMYAKELLADGRGFLVPFNDDEFMASVITDVVGDASKRDGARAQAYKHGRRMTWPHVGKDLEQIFREELLFY